MSNPVILGGHYNKKCVQYLFLLVSGGLKQLPQNLRKPTQYYPFWIGCKTALPFVSQ